MRALGFPGESRFDGFVVSANAPEEAKADGGPLRVRRRAARLSQQRLAELAGCSVAMVRVLEGGYQPTKSKVLGEITKALAHLEDEDLAATRGLVKTSSTAMQGHRGAEV